MRFFYLIKKAISMPPHVAFLKAARKVKREWGEKRRRGQDETKPTRVDPGVTKGWKLYSYLTGLTVPPLPLEVAREESRRILAHEFNLLGSGLVHVVHGMKCVGLEGHCYRMGPNAAGDSEGRWLKDRVNAANLPESRRLWNLIEQNYAPIDWQLDFKSGYRWQEDVLSLDIVYGDKPGADVKVPWELARMQHLPTLAWAFHLAQKEKAAFESPETYLKEFKNQVLDFMALNPPRYGVNWACTMDVAIRAVNWLVAYDLFKAFGAEMGAEFETVFTRSLYEHGVHIRSYLEWDPVLRGNHYLADIAGLLFVSAYLPANRETNRWLSFSVKELQKEVDLQFGADGANFEASTSYHVLSTEMALYATALCLGLPAEKKKVVGKFPGSHFGKLAKAGEFLIDSTHPDGKMVQAGDNDSGRFLKLLPGEREGLDHRHLVSALDGLLDRKDFDVFVGADLAGEKVVEKLAGAGPVPVTTSPTEGERKAYADFGLYLRRTKDSFLALRCGPVGQRGNGGHAHNDQLSFELSIKGTRFVVDPGTYLYTPLSEKRNLMRSTASHNSLVLRDKEQNLWRQGGAGLFSMTKAAPFRVLEFNETKFSAEHKGFGVPHRRTVEWREGGIRFADKCESPDEKTIYLHLLPDVRVSLSGPEVALRRDGVDIHVHSRDGEWTQEEGFYSAGYGLVEKAPVLKLSMPGQVAVWEITWGRDS